MSQASYATISGLFAALAQEFGVLAEHRELSGQQYINELDNPATGSGPDAPPITNTPAEVFNSGADVANVFAAASAMPTPTPAAPAQAALTYRMLPKAGDWTKDQLIDGGWTVEGLLAEGMMEIEPPKPMTPAAPPAPPAMPSPTTQTPAAATPTPGAVERDSSGLPWDARIHSGGRTKKANGEWVARKGVQPGVVAQVTAELRQTAPFVQQPAAHAPLAQPAAAAAQPPAPVPPAPGGHGKTKEQVLAEARAEAELAHARKAAEGIPKPTAEPTDARTLMEWVSANGHGHNMTQVAQMLGLPGFGLILQPENAHLVQTAYTTFLALAQG